MRRPEGAGTRGPYRRPIPADFVELAASGASVTELRMRYRVGQHLIARWIKQIGGKPRSRQNVALRPVPDDFAQWAAVETVDKLMSRYGCGTVLIARWRKESGAPRPHNRPGGQKPIADGFADAAARLNITQLEEHFGVSRATIRKWLERAGLKAARPHRVIVPCTSSMGRPKAAPVITNRDTSRAGMAADYLRRFGPVVRCKANGSFDPKGSHWRRGSTVLCADEIIARAIRNGWNPDAWKVLAA